VKSGLKNATTISSTATVRAAIAAKVARYPTLVIDSPAFGPSDLPHSNAPIETSAAIRAKPSITLPSVTIHRLLSLAVHKEPRA